MEELVTEFNGILAHSLDRGQYFEIDVTTSKNPKSIHISFAPNKLNKNPTIEIGVHNLLEPNRTYATAKTEWGDNAHVNYLNKITEDFNVVIHITDTNFVISFNGESTSKLPYRNAINHLKVIQITGDVKLIRRVDHRQIYPTVWPPSKCIPYYPDEMYCSNDIPIPLKPGHLMVFTGRCYGQPTGNFYINLKHAHNESLLMHMSVDFNAKIVFRSHLDPIEADGGLYSHGFSANHTLGGFPFDFNKPFRIGIACKSSEFLVAVNGLYLFSFAYTNPENRHGSAIVPRPYTDVLSNIVGPKVFSRNGMGIKITGIDHIMLNTPECIGFETYTKNEQC